VRLTASTDACNRQTLGKWLQLGTVIGEKAVGSKSHKVVGEQPGLWYGPATVSGRTTRSGARLAGSVVALALAAASTAAAAGPGDGYRASAARLRVQAQLLDTRTHKALLDLYALESRLGTAERTLAALEARSARLDARRASLARNVVAARLALAISRHQLADRLRMLYEQGTIDPLAVVLGATSLDDALTKLNDLSEIADQSRRIVAVTSDARARLTRVAAALSEQRRRLDAALVEAHRTERQLAAARADRLTFVERLRTRQHLKEARIQALLTTAHAVETKAQKIQARASRATVTDAAPAADPQASAPATAAAETTTASAATGVASPSGEGTLQVSSTGYSLPGHTATGLPVGWGVVAVDPTVIPLGTKLVIPGYGEGVAADVGPGVRGAVIDLWFPTLAQARAWGRQTVTITLNR
jgi:3D (Asp-Asp-Asp) domain-containing protein